MHTFLRGTSAAGTARGQVNGGEVMPTNDLLVRGSTASLVSSIPRTSQPPVPTVPERLSIAISIHHRPVRPVMLLSFYCCSSLAQGDARTRLYARHLRRLPTTRRTGEAKLAARTRHANAQGSELGPL